ncbi:Tripartite ATP-independent periplasmic transporter DctQ [uncultured Alphaproteobacteria bacterium]|uniref:TRAP transporter small permease protein n=1 Tax=uncultured Alphaproteobacteria bacterium TaxID=91750 RepID=A0A212KJ71_9PROT|nr:Tripartite ATP-independent periplasmic transporter DctQ [uncultured Alphaproteobacteria bacterium]
MKRFYQQIGIVEDWIARTFLVVMVVLIFAAAVARLVGSPLNWAIDIATALFAWTCFFAADVAWRANRLMAVESLTNYLTERGRVIFRLVNLAIIGAFLVYVIPAGVWLSWVSRERSFQGIPEMSYSWVTMAMPVGCLVLLATAVVKARADIRLLREYRAAAVDPA